MVDRRLLRAVPLGLVLLMVVVGLLEVATEHWRRGGFVFAVASGVAAVLRLTLPDRVAGLLVIRGRTFDVAFLLALTALFTGAIWLD